MITLEKGPSVLVLMKEPRHLRVLWGSEKQPRSYSQPLYFYGEVVAFTLDVVECMLPFTIHINHKWWEPQDRRIVLMATAATYLLALTPIVTKVPDAKQTKEDSSLCLV